MKVSERFALNEWLSDYPRDKSYEEIIDMIHDRDDTVTPWGLVECYSPYDVVEYIDNTRSHLESVIEQSQNEEQTA